MRLYWGNAPGKKAPFEDEDDDEYEDEYAGVAQEACATIVARRGGQRLP